MIRTLREMHISLNVFKVACMYLVLCIPILCYMHVFSILHSANTGTTYQNIYILSSNKHCKLFLYCVESDVPVATQLLLSSTTISTTG